MKLLKNKKVLAVAVAGVIALGGCGIYAYNVSAEKNQEKIEISEGIKSIELQNKLFEKKVTQLEKKIDGLEESPNVAKFDSDVPIKITKIKEELKPLVKVKKDFVKQQETRLETIQNSYNQALEAQTVVLALFDKENVKDDVTRESYDSAKQKVDVLKQVELKKQLTEKLKLVETKLNEKEQVVAETAKKEVEQQEQAKQQQQQQEQVQQEAVSNQQASASGNGSSNAGYTDNSSSKGSSGSTPQTNTGGSQGNNSNSSSTPPAQTPPPANNNSNGSSSGGNSWNTGNANNGGVVGGQNNNNGTGTENSWEGGDWDYN